MSMVTGERHDTVMSVIMTNAAAAAAGTGCLFVCVCVIRVGDEHREHVQVSHAGTGEHR